jgi:hypothetical protein
MTNHPNRGSARQAKITEAMRLLRASRTYGDGYMHGAFKALGATMRERTGKVDSWVRGKSPAALDDLLVALGGDPAAIEAKVARDLADFADR